VPRLRENIVTGEWVVIAPGRSKRPQDFISATSAKRVSKKDCPFCLENNIAYKNSIKEFETDNVYVIPNLYPAFVGEDEVSQIGGDFYPSYKSIGGHDVIILKDHDKELENLRRPVLEEYYHTYQKRINYFKKNPVVEYSMVIHNFGPEAGASIVHPHSQLMASAIVPPRVEMEIEGSKKYYQEHKTCVFCDLIKNELEDQIRIIGENKYFLAFTFWASRFPFETWILPKKHRLFFEDIGRTERLALADIFKSVLTKFDHSLNQPPYNYYIHTGPPRMENQKDLDKFYHWHIEIAPRVNTFGGYELGSNLVIDVVSPEKAARFLNKEEIPQQDETFA
jgi:UDPglucose--hexose-1-phosphate uridylyltransferase